MVTRRLKLLAILMVVAMLAAACGGDAGQGAQSQSSASTAEQDDGSGDSGGGSGADDGAGDQDSDDNASGTSGGDGPPQIDPNAMPPAGQAVFEVDGQTFTIDSADMDYFLCDPSDEFTNVQSESETQDLGVQSDAQSGRGGANVTVAGSNLVYGSFFGPETAGGLAVEPPHIVYEGLFDAYDPDNASDVTVLGIGRVSVTCP